MLLLTLLILAIVYFIFRTWSNVIIVAVSIFDLMHVNYIRHNIIIIITWLMIQEFHIRFELEYYFY